MKLSQRILSLVKLGQYMINNDAEWQKTKEKAFAENPWFLPEFIETAVQNIAHGFLQEATLAEWLNQYPTLQNDSVLPRKIGIVMAGNIPLVGFHDFLCVFLSGHRGLIKPSSKDDVLIRHLLAKLVEWTPSLSETIQLAERLNGCDAYIATGSNNTGNYFKYYFGKYPHIIRRNRTSAGILTGTESAQELENLADDVYLYFGMGCRNITKIYVPESYDFQPLLKAFDKYNYLAEVNKYKNNYDYNLTLLILNNKPYMSNESLLIVEDKNLFSPVSQLHYETYCEKEDVIPTLTNNQNIQCIAGSNFTPFGSTQCPAVNQYADGEDTMAFLQQLQ